jgi:FtsP/CotA-like multicopper oxidase with cupredoxin domain
MIDGTPVYMLGYGFVSGGMDKRNELHTPGPVLWAREGELLRLRITNDLEDDHSFLIRREDDIIIDSGAVAAGTSVDIEFVAPSAGTYLYQDGVNMPVNRVLGLQGTVISMPADGTMTPHPDLDTWEFDTQWVWQCNEIDPAFNARAQAGRVIDAADFENNFKPRYFTLNGRMGSLAAHVETAPDTMIEDKVGHPSLVRVVNGGLAVHGPHVHGNHVFVLMRNARVHDTIMWKDTIMVEPEVTTDFMLPFTIPPNAVYWPPHPDGVAFLEELHGKDIEGTWPMHCHVEMSQTAGGGLYPQGLLTDWKLKP